MLLPRAPIRCMGETKTGTAEGANLPPILPAVATKPNSDLTAAAFVLLRQTFFDPQCKPIPFELRAKKNTQDDPFDEYVTLMLKKGLTDSTCVKSPGALITPDLVVMRPKLCEGVLRAQLRNDLTRIVGIEVKKLERTPAGGVARASGMDYNTTPPCGTVAIYDSREQMLPVRGFYMYVCVGAAPGGSSSSQVTALLLADGDLLNADFDYYLSIVGTRKKEIGLGTYGDGANRNRPMLIFSNPLGSSDFDRKVTLIHPSPTLHDDFSELRQVGIVERTIPKKGKATFYAYRVAGDVQATDMPFNRLDPFPTPERSEDTSGRGKFRVDVRPLD